jgi:hypothetical protein
LTIQPKRFWIVVNPRRDPVSRDKDPDEPEKGQPWNQTRCFAKKNAGTALGAFGGERWMMRTFLMTVLSVIALGVMLIAYGLLAPRVDAAPVVAQQPGYVQPVAYAPRPTYATSPTRASYATYQPRAARIAVAPKRDWKKTALVIGGSTAAGAGIGGIFGGGKGAAIGAAIGGGASTLFEALHK